MPDNDRELKRKRRKARAALVLLRRRITSVCGKAMDAGKFYDKVAAYTAPVMSEYGEVLPSDARGHMDRLMELLTERRDEAETACRLCKGEVQAAIKGVTAQLGIQGAVLNTLRPIEDVAPSWLVDGPLAEVAVALAVVLVGGSVAAGFAVLASGGGTEEEATAASVPSSTPITFEAETGPQGTPETSAAPLAIASACDVLTPEIADSHLLGPVPEMNGTNGRVSSCDYLVPGNPVSCESLTLTLYPPNYFSGSLPWSGSPAIEGVGDEAYSPDNSDYRATLNVRKGDVWADISVTCSQGGDALGLAMTVADSVLANEWLAVAVEGRM